MNLELSVIIPTYNERDNIKPLVEKIKSALVGVNWEVIFVDDDSKDKTVDIIHDLAQTDCRIRCLRRINRRGLSSACIEGMLSSSAEYLAVMDADMQHDEKVLLTMINLLKKEDIDIVVGSRYLEGDCCTKWSKKRLKASKFATALAKMLLGVKLTDPMSGFFMLKRSFLKRVVYNLSGKGFKILLDIFSSSPEPIRFKETPYVFGTRFAGKSKLDLMVLWEYAVLISDKSLGKFVPVRFVFFVLVGLVGLVVHLIILFLLMRVFLTGFLIAQAVATFLAMTANFIFNNIFTYHDLKLKGLKFVRGLLTFYFACGIGAFINLKIASFLYLSSISWWLAGILGAVVGAVWNFAITSTLTWTDTNKLDRAI